MQLHDVQRKNTNKTKKRVGRGGTRGKTSGRGHKGQKARAGHHIRPAIRDLIKKLPKRRGYGKNRARTVNDSRAVSVPVKLSDLDKVFRAGDTVTPRTLAEKGVIRMSKGKRAPIKILAHGTLTKKLTIEKCLASKTATDQITKAGGSVS